VDAANTPLDSGRRADQNPVLLVIDDAPEIHRLLAVRLKDEGLEFVTALSGMEGLELAESQQPSLILLDLNMPDHDGFEVLHRLKDTAATMEIPVIVLSADTNAASKVRAFEVGAMDYVTKPMDIAELRARIQSAIRLSRLMKLLEQRAQIDGLTGLWNRNHLNDRLARDLAETARKNTPLSLVMCDLDHFKRLNDTYGHPAGDAVLQTFAVILTRELRAYDVACRYGGEEFALILPRTTAEEAVGVCERIRRALELTSYKKYPEMHATASFGIADRAEDGSHDPARLIEAADKTLYHAKQNGRNRVHIYGPKGPVAPHIPAHNAEAQVRLAG
jgi:diguanylate cyclase (GGDEF)-like protein